MTSCQRIWTLWLVVSVAALELGLVSRVHAHPDLERGLQYSLGAEFERSIMAFDAALSSGVLSRDKLVVLLGERAFARLALEQSDALDADLRYLALLDPAHDFGVRAPPTLIARW